MQKKVEAIIISPDHPGRLYLGYIISQDQNAPLYGVDSRATYDSRDRSSSTFHLQVLFLLSIQAFLKLYCQSSWIRVVLSSNVQYIRAGRVGGLHTYGVCTVFVLVAPGSSDWSDPRPHNQVNLEACWACAHHRAVAIVMEQHLFDSPVLSCYHDTTFAPASCFREVLSVGIGRQQPHRGERSVWGFLQEWEWANWNLLDWSYWILLQAEPCGSQDILRHRILALFKLNPSSMQCV